MNPKKDVRADQSLKSARQKSVTGTQLFKEMSGETKIPLTTIKKLVQLLFEKTGEKIREGKNVTFISWYKIIGKRLKDQVRSPKSGLMVKPKYQVSIRGKAGAKMMQVINGLPLSDQKSKKTKSVTKSKSKTTSKTSKA